MSVPSIKEFIFTLFILIPAMTYAQDAPVITFLSKTYDFGSIEEADGKQEGVFHYRNDGKADLFVTEVKPGCGCTTSDYTRTAVKPGMEGFIKVVFDPKDIPGKFNKNITVKSNDPEHPLLVLFIKGNVTPAPGNVLDTFNMPQGNLYFMSNHAAFGDINRTGSSTDTLWAYNYTGKPMKWYFRELPGHIKAVASPENIAPFGKGMIILTYDASMKNDWGFVMDRFDLHTNDSAEPVKWLVTSANIIEDFAGFSRDDSLNAPRMKYSGRIFTFDTLEVGQAASFDFKFSNEGRSDLVIHKISSSCGCTATNPDKMTIKPGEESKIGITFDSSGRADMQHKVITVITNDPLNHTVKISVQGFVRR